METFACDCPELHEGLLALRDGFDVPLAELEARRRAAMPAHTWRSLLRPLGAIAAAMVLVTAGYAAGARREPSVLTDVRLLGTTADSVELQAVAGRDVHLELRRDDPFLRRALIEPWLRNGSLYERMEATKLASHDQLIGVLLHDPSDAVRLLAEARLMEMPGGRDLQRAFLEIVRSDGGSVGLKIAAIDYLIANGVDRDALRLAIRNDSTPTALRAQHYLQD